MTTYRQFLIHSNLRCYYDNRGSLEPKFPYIEFKTIEEAKARIDKFHDEADQWESRRAINYQKSLSVLLDDTDRSDEARELEADRFEERVNEYWEREHLEDK